MTPSVPVPKLRPPCRRHRPWQRVGTDSRSLRRGPGNGRTRSSNDKPPNLTARLQCPPPRASRQPISKRRGGPGRCIPFPVEGNVGWKASTPQAVGKYALRMCVVGRFPGPEASYVRQILRKGGKASAQGLRRLERQRRIAHVGGGGGVKCNSWAPLNYGLFKVTISTHDGQRRATPKGLFRVAFRFQPQQLLCPVQTRTPAPKHLTSSVLDLRILSMCASLVLAVSPCHGSFPCKRKSRAATVRDAEA